MARIKDEIAADFDEFLRLIGRRDIRLVKLADYGLVEPVTEKGVTVMQPMVRIVATAFDKASGTLVRWEDKRRTRQGIHVCADGGASRHSDKRSLALREHLTQRLQIEGYNVADGEWTADQLQSLISSN